MVAALLCYELTRRCSWRAEPADRRAVMATHLLPAVMVEVRPARQGAPRSVTISRLVGLVELKVFPAEAVQATVVTERVKMGAAMMVVTEGAKVTTL